jgi:hypothetical protein
MGTAAHLLPVADGRPRLWDRLVRRVPVPTDESLARGARRWSIGLAAGTGVGVVAGVVGFVSGTFDPLVADVVERLPFVTGPALPAAALAAVVGVPQVAALVAAVRRDPRAPWVATLAGAALATWVAAQGPVVGWSSPLQPIFFAVGVSETVVGYAWVCLARTPRMRA